MLYIRADGNKTIGSGHIMRCLSIANALKKLGENSIFISADNYSEGLVNQYGFESICLNSNWENLEDETQLMRNLLNTNNIKKLLIDSYFATPKYIEDIHSNVKIAYLDDLENIIYPVDLLINYSINADKKQYDIKYPNTRLLIGSYYIPLREQFYGKQHILKDKIKDILVTTGGSDSYNVTNRLIIELRENSVFNDINLHIVVGAFNVYYDEIIYLSKKYHNIFIYQNIENMAELMVRCDLAISAGGTTLYELCACMIPIIAFTFADNQISGVKALSEHGLLFYVGDIRTNMETCIVNILQGIQRLDQNPGQREGIMRNMKNKVDGLGANRIANEILIL